MLTLDYNLRHIFLFIHAIESILLIFKLTFISTEINISCIYEDVLLILYESYQI